MAIIAPAREPFGALGVGVSGKGVPDIVSVNRLVLLAAIPVFLGLAVVAYLTFVFAANERDAQAMVRHTYQVMEAQRRLMDDVLSVETGGRGYLLSQDPFYLTAFRNRAAVIPANLRALRDLTVDNPGQRARADRLEKMIATRIQGLEAAVRGPARTGPMTDAAAQGMARSRVQMTAIRAEIMGGLAEEQKLLAVRDTNRRNQEQMVVAFAIGGAVSALGILLIAAAMLVRNNISLAAARAARENEAAILQGTLDTVRDGIAYFTSEGLLCAFNGAFFRLLNLPAHMARKGGTRLEDLIGAGVPAHIASPPDGEVESDHASFAGRELNIYKGPVSTGGYLIGLSDVTARLQAESRMRQSQKMEAIGHLTGGVAHDFNNLLQIVSANLELAVNSAEAQATPKLGQRLQNALGAVSRGARLTGQLLAFARRQALDPRSVDLGRVIRDMTDLLRRTLGEQIQVETVIAGGLWNTLVDPTQVENAILNLAINARDAMEGNGKLTLEVANAHLDDAYAGQHADVHPGQYVMLAVSDTGCGMPPDVIARVFEPFFTTKAEGKGTGLGLAQAYGFVRQSGGHIKIYSEVGEGTVVKLYLPRTRKAEDALEPSQALPALGGNESILVVEDDEGVRAAVVDMLTELGYAVRRAGNAESALEILRGGVQVDLLFTDVVMPGKIPTREFTRMAQQLLPGLKVLYTSGYTQNAIVHNGKLDDDAFLLSKPYRKNELARKLRSVLAGTARGPLAPAPAPAPANAAAPAAGAKVLVVEDVMLIRMATVDMVEQLGFTVLEAGDGIEAMAQLQAHDDIAILLTDLGLPGMDGRALVVEARKLRPGIKVVIASGYSDPSGADIDALHLPKPFDLNQLRSVLV